MRSQWLFYVLLYLTIIAYSYGKSEIEPTFKCMTNPEWNPLGTTLFGGFGHGEKQLNYPTGIFIEPNSQIIYVADTGNDRIQKRYPNGTIVTAVGANQNLSRPQDVIADEHENIFVVDSNNQRVVYFEKGSLNGKTVAGNTTRGSLLNELSYPSRVMITSTKDLIIADTNNQRIVLWSFPYDPSTSQGKVIAGGHGAGFNLSQLDSPSGLYYSESDSTLYIANQQSHSVFEWIKGNTRAHKIVAGVIGVHGSSAVQLNNPKGIILDQDKNLYVADSENNRIQRFCLYSKTGITIAGQGAPGNSDVHLNGPSDIAFDEVLNLYVVDTLNSRVQRFERTA